LRVERAVARPGAEPKLNHSHYRHIHVAVIRPESDLGGLGGFLKFDPATAKKFIADGERDTERALGCYEERHIAAADGSHLTVRCERAASAA